MRLLFIRFIGISVNVNIHSPRRFGDTSSWCSWQRRLLLAIQRQNSLRWSIYPRNKISDCPPLPRGFAIPSTREGKSTLLSLLICPSFSSFNAYVYILSLPSGSLSSYHIRCFQPFEPTWPVRNFIHLMLYSTLPNWNPHFTLSEN